MKDPVRQQGSILQSLRARNVENRHDKNKTQHVIYEGREVDQGKPEEEALLDALLELEKGSRWRIILPEILLGTASNSFTRTISTSFRMRMVECCSVVSTHHPSLVHSGEEAMWFRAVGTLLPLSPACYKIPSRGEIHYNTYWTAFVKNLLVGGTTRLSCHEQFW